MIKLELIDEDEFMDFEEFVLHMDESKELRNLEKLYLSNLDKGKDYVDYQLIFEVMKNLDLLMEESLYLLLKNQREELINTLIRNQFKDCGVDKISKKFLDFLKRILITYIDLDEPLCIDKFYSFEEKLDSDVLKQAMNQVVEGKVENRIFKEVKY